MRKKQPVSFSERFPKADPGALKLMQRLLAFDPTDRPTAEEVNVLNITCRIEIQFSSRNPWIKK